MPRRKLIRPNQHREACFCCATAVPKNSMTEHDIPGHGKRHAHLFCMGVTVRITPNGADHPEFNRDGSVHDIEACEAKTRRK